ncbi:hypothetical protein [Marinifilum caeruleilacunae]|uniref:Lipoprotein n=1 Tax=Marinifilum caeruleilacunae TaxID=2499076 RepID=A0ABX1WZK8_9BACT|nr:hypothetical protein [Marinifilum caeruleilacunae]NOU61336.1 hypothetical protein [Marinifilum caeruleilacunae]
MRNLFYILCSVLLIPGFVACDNDEGLNTDPEFRLSFSVDTLSFDTLFTGFGSTTMQFKVYNKSSKRVNVEEVFLQDNNSPYRLNVNGLTGENFSNIEIGANDSLFVFVEVDLKENNADDPVLLEDILVFNVNGKLQGLILSTWAQDVVLVEDNILSSQNWTGNRPYLVNQQIAINENVILGMDKGTRVYFGKNAGMDIHGSVQINGSFEEPVYLGSSRLEELYENVPGQWNGLYFHESSSGNVMSYFRLEDGINGIKFQGNENGPNELELEYGVIQNFTENGISATHVDLVAHDLLVLNCGDECLRVENGEFDLYHSTFYNSWNFDVRTLPVIQLMNATGKSIEIANCIVWGSQRDELMIDNTTGLQIENTLLKLGNSLQTDYSSIFSNCIFNENPEFTSLEERLFTLSDISPCINSGKVEFGVTFPLDLQNTARNVDAAPDMGAYEFKEALE